MVKQGSTLTKPDELLLSYMGYIPEQNYKEMLRCIVVRLGGTPIA